MIPPPSALPDSSDRRRRKAPAKGIVVVGLIAKKFRRDAEQNCKKQKEGQAAVWSYS